MNSLKNPVHEMGVEDDEMEERAPADCKFCPNFANKTMITNNKVITI